MVREVEEDERREKPGQGQEKNERGGLIQLGWMGRWGWRWGWGWGMMQCSAGAVLTAQATDGSACVQRVCECECERAVCRQCEVSRCGGRGGFRSGVPPLLRCSERFESVSGSSAGASDSRVRVRQFSEAWHQKMS